MSRLIGYLIAVTTAILNWFAFKYFGGLLGVSDPSFVATTVLASIVIHELGHLIVLEANGIKTHLIFLVILGGAIPDPTHKERLNALSWSAKAGIYLAGVFGNIFMIVGCGVLYGLGIINGRELTQVANLNGNLILFNLLPLWIFDGGRFAKVLFDSVSEDRDHNFVIGIFVTVAVMGVIMAILTPEIFVTTLIWLLWGLQFQARRDDPYGSYDKRSMTVTEQRNWAGIYVFLLCLGIILLSTTPPWTKL